MYTFSCVGSYIFLYQSVCQHVTLVSILSFYQEKITKSHIEDDSIFWIICLLKLSLWKFIYLSIKWGYRSFTMGTYSLDICLTQTRDQDFMCLSVYVSVCLFFSFTLTTMLTRNYWLNSLYFQFLGSKWQSVNSEFRFFNFLNQNEKGLTQS